MREIMLKFKCGKTQIYETLKDQIVSEWMHRNGQMNEKYKFLVRYSIKKQLPEHELLVTAYIKIHTVYNSFNTVYVILTVLK